MTGGYKAMRSYKTTRRWIANNKDWLFSGFGASTLFFVLQLSFSPAPDSTAKTSAAPQLPAAVSSASNTTLTPAQAQKKLVPQEKLKQTLTATTPSISSEPPSFTLANSLKMLAERIYPSKADELTRQDLTDHSAAQNAEKSANESHNDSGFLTEATAASDASINPEAATPNAEAKQDPSAPTDEASSLAVRDELARTTELAALYQKQGKLAEAELLYEKATSMAEQAGLDAATKDALFDELAIVYTQQGKYQKAETIYQKILSTQGSSASKESLLTLNKLATLYSLQGNYGAATPLFERILQNNEQQLGASSLQLVAALDNLASLYEKQNQFAKAESAALRSLSIREKNLGTQHADVVDGMNRMAMLYKNAAKYKEAEDYLQRSLAIVEQTQGSDHINTAYVLSQLAHVEFITQNLEQADRLYVRAIDIYDKVLPDGDPTTITTYEFYISVLRAMGRDYEADIIEDYVNKMRRSD